jgi:hypothetical protein
VTINKAAAAWGATVTRLHRVNSKPKAVAVADGLSCLEIGAAEWPPLMKECAMFIRIYGKDRAPLHKSRRILSASDLREAYESVAADVRRL